MDEFVGTLDRDMPAPPDGSGPPRTGYVTLVGAPNVGKSTLLNALVGEKLSIVTEKAQTTWKRVTGISTRDGVQMIFLDTPGLLEARDLFQRSMYAAAVDALHEADVLLVVLDATRPPEAARSVLEELVEDTSAPRIAAVNKVDTADPDRVASWSRWASTRLGADVHQISALERMGLDALRASISERLPPAPFLYPPEDLASESIRFFVEELIRETVFERFRQEIPYSVIVRIEEFREEQEPVYIGASVFVERKSQKGILVGKKGSAIRELGRRARAKIETLLGEPVYLDLWVKVLEGWRRRRRELEKLGFRVPRDQEDPGAGT